MMYDFLNKERNLRQLNNYIYAKTLSMFDYTGLPETIPAIEMEKILQQKGFGFVSEVKGELYLLTGSFSGDKDAYGNEKSFRVDNPYLKFSKELDLKNDGVLIQNDDMMNGLAPLLDRINSLLIENEVTMYIDNYNSRIQTLLSAGDEPTRESAEKYLEKVKKGELGVIAETQIFDGIKTHNANSTSQNTTIHLIEFNQYLKASLYNELGLDANYNMKRERLNSNEVKMNNDALHPFIDNMLSSRKQAIEKINAKYGLNVTVEFGSIWEIKKSDIELEKEEVEETESDDSVQPVQSSGVTIEQLVLNITPSEISIPDVEEIEDEIEEEKEGENDDVQRMEEGEIESV